MAATSDRRVEEGDCTDNDVLSEEYCTNSGASSESVSLRCIGRRLDAERPAKRIGGNRPPELRDSGTDVDQFVDYYLPIEKVSWNEKSKEVLENIRRHRVRRHARDLGMAHRRDKGVLELHRFQSEPERASLRDIVERHQSGDEFRLLLFNAGLFRASGVATQYADINQRKREIGRMIRSEEYDIVGLNEVWFPSQQNSILANVGDVVWWGSPPYNDGDAIGNNGLMTLLVDNEGGLAPALASTPVESTAFGLYGKFDAAGVDLFADKGWQYTEIDLGREGNLDFFVTHLNHAQGGPGFRGAREDQIDDLLDAVDKHSKDENVTIVGGDFNVKGTRNEYDEMIEAMDERADLQDVWLTRGGKIARTSYFDEERFWPLFYDLPPGLWDYKCYHEDCYCDPYIDISHEHRFKRNERLDYLFVEAPKESHKITVDIKRARRKLFPRVTDNYASPNEPWQGSLDCAIETADCPFGTTHCDTESYLSDHMGLELTLLVNSG